jgi:hypothetical protein
VGEEGPDRIHGTVDQRLQAFEVGYLSGEGLYACVGFLPGTPIVTSAALTEGGPASEAVLHVLEVLESRTIDAEDR